MERLEIYINKRYNFVASVKIIDTGFDFHAYLNQVHDYINNENVNEVNKQVGYGLTLTDLREDLAKKGLEWIGDRFEL